MKVPLFYSISLLSCVICYSALQAVNPPAADPDILLRGAYEKQISGNIQEAANLYRQYFEAGGEGAYVRLEYARVLFRLGNFADAEAQASLSRSQNPGCIDCIITHAIIQFRSGKTVVAIESLEKASETYPDNPDLEFNLAELLSESGKNLEAKIQYIQVLFHLGNAGSRAIQYRSIALWKLASIFFQERDFLHARLYMSRYVKYNPERVYPRFILGYHLQFLQNDYSGAVENLETISSIDAKTAAEQSVEPALVHSALAQMRFLAGRPDFYRSLMAIEKYRQRNALEESLYSIWNNENEKALHQLLPLLKSNPENFIIRFAILYVLQKINRKDLLLDELLRVASLSEKNNQQRMGLDMCLQALRIKEEHPEYPTPLSQIYQQIASLYQSLGQNRRAIVYFEKTLEEGTRENRWQNWEDKAEIFYALASVMSNGNVAQYSEAAAFCDSLISEKPDYARSYYVRGIVRLREGRPLLAVEDFNRSIEAGANDISQYYYRGMAFHEADDFESAEKDLRKVLSMNANFADANNFLSYMFARSGRNLEEALELAQKAVNAFPTNGAYHDSLGWVYFQSGKFDQSLYHIQLANELLEESGGADPIVLQHLGEIYEKKGQIRKAQASYARALSILSSRRKTSLHGKLSDEDERTDSEIRQKMDRIMKDEQG